MAATHRPSRSTRPSEPEPAAPRVGRRLTALPTTPPATPPAVPLSAAERRWLQTWRALTREERVLAEQLVARIAAQANVERVPHAS